MSTLIRPAADSICVDAECGYSFESVAVTNPFGEFKGGKQVGYLAGKQSTQLEKLVKESTRARARTMQAMQEQYEVRLKAVNSAPTRIRF